MRPVGMEGNMRTWKKEQNSAISVGTVEQAMVTTEDKEMR
jgi:hypothetical protein